ncbi:MAG: SusC/RagA family TonB-linked outer membrane protein [Saprospiraceae bacterium]|nr:SusC/RagA family TonB-linked outer membrane protein [Saprospiraceae bacterium]
MKKLSLILFVLLCSITVGLAQKTVTGSVKDPNGEPLIGANVLVQGTSIGTVTDIDGMFSIQVPGGRNALLITYIGFADKVVDVTDLTSVDVNMAEGQLLDEVVVTALGIKRDKKALGYASTTVGSDDIARKPETDVARALAGRSPGVNIASSAGLAGSGTKINIRGVSTISGNSQPLWVVDGVPINTSANENNDFNDGNITPTRNLDIDPNNIESMSILRGLAATTLYGSQGRNGVILITTKTGGGGSGVKKYNASFSQSYGQITAHIPEYQNKWANGFDGDYGEFFSNWGVLFSDNYEAAVHPYSEQKAVFPELEIIQGKYKVVNTPNNIKDFFQKGQAYTTSFQAGINGDIGNFNVAMSKLSETGYIKNNKLDRFNLSIGGSANISSRLKLNGSFSYIKTDFKSPTIGAGLGSNTNGGPSVFANLFYTPRNIDLMNLPYQNPITGASVYYRAITNPRWLLENSSQGSFVNRFMSMMGATYKVNDWLTANYRIGVDSYDENQEYWVQKGSVGYVADVAAFGTGLLRTTDGNNVITDQNFGISGQRELNDDLDITFNVGANHRDDKYSQTGLESSNQVVFGLISHRNFTTTNSRDLRNNNLSYIQRRIIMGLYGDLTFGYKNYLYLNVAARNDWASSHEKEYRSQFYPGFSVSFVPTDAFESLSESFLDYMKLRAGYGTSANFADPYNTRAVLSLNSNETVDANGNVVSLGLPSLLANPNLRPELQSELEFGVEAKLLNNRIGLDFSWYNRKAEDQIIERPLDPSTGYSSTFLNAGTVTNKGVEIGFTLSPVASKNITWNLRANFTKNVSKVVDLPEGSEEILIGGFTNLGAFAIKDQPFGVIKSTYVVKDDKGNLLVNSNGDWKISSEIGIIGDPNPDFMLSGFSDLTVYGLTLSGQLDFVKGGDIFSYSAATPIGRGVAKELEDFNPTITVILPGVLEETGEVNNIPQPASGVFFNNTIIGGGAYDRGIYDATRLRLREISLSYNLPKSIFNGTFIESASISLVGNNIWYRAFNTPASSKVDPDRTAFGTNNASGFDFLGGPSAARYGGTVKFNF